MPPPLTGLAVNVTEVLAQTGLADGDIVILAGRSEPTTIVTVLDVAGLPLTQEAFDVSTHVTASLFTGVNV